MYNGMATVTVYSFTPSLQRPGAGRRGRLPREGDAARTVANMEIASLSLDFLYYSANWKGALYARCEYGFVLRYILHASYPHFVVYFLLPS
jgi:hypothetical protein